MPFENVGRMKKRKRLSGVGERGAVTRVASTKLTVVNPVPPARINFAADDIDRLNAGGAIVNTDDFHVTIVVRDAGFFHDRNDSPR